MRPEKRNTKSRVFGFPGDGINGIMGAFNRASDEAPEWIQTRHEEMVAFMACAHAKFAYPNRVPVAVVGDGTMLMNGMNSLVTIADYWKRWIDPRLVILVLHNNDLNQVTWEMRVMEGDPKFEASQDVPDFNYAHYAESIGLKGIRVETPAQIKPAWQEAFAADRPVVVDALADPDVPPLPPHISVKQAKAYATTLLKGDPDEAGIIKQTVKGVTDTLKH